MYSLTFSFASLLSLFKSMLCAAFAHQMVLGRTEVNTVFSKIRKTAKNEVEFMEKNEIEPTKCIVMRNLSQAKSCDLKELLNWLLPNMQYQYTFDDDKTAFIYFPTLVTCQDFQAADCNHSTLSRTNHVDWQDFIQETSVFTTKVPREFYTLWQFGERRSVWSMDSDSVLLTRLEHPFSLVWENMSPRKEMVGVMSFRNPSAFVCDFTNKELPYLGVVTSLQGGENLTCFNARKVTILPSIEQSVVALICILLFQCCHSNFELEVDKGSSTITGLSLNSQALSFGGFQTLTLQDVIRVNILRRVFSEALNCTNGSGLLPVALLRIIPKLLSSVLLQQPIPVTTPPSQCDSVFAKWEQQFTIDDNDYDSEFEYNSIDSTSDSAEIDSLSFKFYPPIKCSILDSVSFVEAKSTRSSDDLECCTKQKSISN